MLHKSQKCIGLKQTNLDMAATEAPLQPLLLTVMYQVLIDGHPVQMPATDTDMVTTVMLTVHLFILEDVPKLRATCHDVKTMIDRSALQCCVPIDCLSRWTQWRDTEVAHRSRRPHPLRLWDAWLTDSSSKEAPVIFTPAPCSFWTDRCALWIACGVDLTLSLMPHSCWTGVANASLSLNFLCFTNVADADVITPLQYLHWMDTDAVAIHRNLSRRLSVIYTHTHAGAVVGLPISIVTSMRRHRIDEAARGSPPKSSMAALMRIHVKKTSPVPPHKMYHSHQLRTVWRGAGTPNVSVCRDRCLQSLHLRELWIMEENKIYASLRNMISRNMISF